MVNAGYKLDIPKIKEALDRGIETPKGIINWKYLIKLIKEQRNEQINALVNSSDPWATSILDKHQRSSLDQTSCNYVFYYILKPFIEEMKSWGKHNCTEAQFVWNRISEMQKTSKKIDVFLAWLWCDHKNVATQFYQDIGLAPRPYQHPPSVEHLQKQNDLSNVSKESSTSKINVGTAVYDMTDRELTEQEREQIRLQIEKIGQDGLVSIWLEFIKINREKGVIKGTFDCAEKGVYIKCDGLNYDFRASLLDIVVEFEVRGFLLKPKIPTNPRVGDIEIAHHCNKSFPCVWMVAVKYKNREKPLCGRLTCRSTNGILFDFKMLRNTDSPSITATHILERNDVKIERVLKNYRNRNPEKEELISLIMEQEIVRICGGQTEKYNSEYSMKLCSMEYTDD